MSQTDPNFCPPRGLTVPQFPVPQTNYGVLEHTGLPIGEFKDVTDVPPDFGWMTLMQRYIGSFEYSKNSKIGDTLRKYSVLADVISGKRDMMRESITWQHIPFITSKWWTGSVSFKFIAIKPPRVTGKLLVRYFFTPASQDEVRGEDLCREVVKEWDLGQSNVFEFDLTSICPIGLRPTWLPRVQGTNATDAIGSRRIMPQEMIYPMYAMGEIVIQPAQRIQVGSIFPDSIRILVFKCFKNATFSMPTDPRSTMPHSFLWSNAPWLEKNSIWG